MKNKAFIVFALINFILLCNITIAQKVFITPIIGYSFGINGGDWQTHSTNTTVTTNGADTSISSYDTYVHKQISFGGGISTGLTIGYNINKKITASVDFFYQYGKNQRVLSNDLYYVNGVKNAINYSTNYRSRTFSFDPNITIFTGNKRVNPFIKLGLILERGKIIEHDTIKFTGLNFFPEIIVQKWKLSGNTMFGFYSSVGIETKISKIMSLDFEVSYKQISFIPTKGKIDIYTINGMDWLPGSNISDKEIEFVDAYSNQNPTEKNKPLPVLKPTFNENSILIQLGLKLFL